MHFGERVKTYQRSEIPVPSYNLLPDVGKGSLFDARDYVH